MDTSTLKRDAQGNVIKNTTGQDYSFTASGDIDYSKSGSNYRAPQPSPYVPTVMTDANIREKTIPDIQSRASTIAPNTSPLVGSMEYDIANNLAPGTSSQPGYKASGSTTGSTSADIYKGLYDEANQSETTLSPEQQQLFTLQKSMLDKQSADAMAAIRAKFDVRNRQLVEGQESQTKGVETALSLGGSDRYSPVSSSGILSAKERYDMQTLADLQTEEEGLLSQVRQAQTAGEMQILQKRLDALETKRKEKIDLAGKIATDLAAQNKALLERKQNQDDKYTTDTQSIVLDMAKNNAPKAVKDKVNELIRNKASYAEIANAAGEYLQGGTGIIGEYQFYKRNLEARGLTPKSFEEYQNDDANRKISVAQAAINSGNLTPVQQQTFMRISDKFQADSVMSAATKGKTAMETADRVLLDPSNAGGQLSILYTLVKSLDPDSAVREGEIALAQQTQSYLSKFGTTLEKIGSGKVVATDAAKLLAEETKKLAQSWYDAGKRREGQYKSQAQVAGVGDAFNTYLGGFERPYIEQEVDKERNAEQAIIDYGKKNPQQQEYIKSLVNDVNPNTGKPFTYQEMGQILGIPISFSSVGGDTNQASVIADAIKSVESGGNYVAKGGSGESGAYQFMSATWKAWAKEYLGDANAPMTNENQDRVATAKINDLLEEGHSPYEVALIWNGGEAKEKKGVNKYGVAYDSGAYAKKVLSKLS